MSLHLALAQALNEYYLVPARKLLHSKLQMLNTLYEQDRFALDPAAAEALEKRIRFLAREAEVLNNLIESTDHTLLALIEQHAEMYQTYLMKCAEVEYWKAVAQLLGNALKDCKQFKKPQAA